MSPVQQIRGTDVLDQTVKNIDLGSDVARLTLLPNGGFEIWQRGNGPFTANGVYTADRWQIFLAGTDTVSVTRSTSQQPASAYALQVAYTRVTGGSQIYQALKDA